MGHGEVRRTDSRGRAFAGSQLQIQIYVNRRPDDVNANIRSALGPALPARAEIVWRSPLESEGFAEYRDGEFLAALGLPHLREKLAGFWPEGGPRWDGLAIVNDPAKSDPSAYLLVEAKSYPKEVFGPGCQAQPDSRRTIEAALRVTKAWAGAEESADWLGALYQYGNRLAHVYFLRQIANLRAWLVNLCFLGDPHRPTGRAVWENGLTAIREGLGFRGRRVPYTVNVFLSAPDQSELAKSLLNNN